MANRYFLTDFAYGFRFIEGRVEIERVTGIVEVKVVTQTKATIQKPGPHTYGAITYYEQQKNTLV